MRSTRVTVLEGAGFGLCGGKVTMATNDNNDLVGSEADSAENGFQPGRRKVMIAGALLVPTIVTLHGTPAWAQTDYELTAYRYGDNKGKCRNPFYNDQANDNSPNSEEFIECTKGRPHDDPGGPTQESGPEVF